MIENKVSEMEKHKMELELYSRKLFFLQNIKSLKDLQGVKLKGLDPDINLTQDDLPYSLKETIFNLIDDSITFYEMQIEHLNNLINK